MRGCGGDERLVCYGLLDKEEIKLVFKRNQQDQQDQRLGGLKLRLYTPLSAVRGYSAG